MKKQAVLKALSLGLTAALCTGVLAGCGSSGSAQSGGGGQTTAAPDQTTEQAAGGGEAAPGSDTNKIIVGITTDPNTFDPYVSNNTGRLVVFPEIYEPLAAYDSMGGDFNGIIAKSWEWVDDSTVDITIYDYIRDSGGNAITASDVVFSWETAKASGNFSKITPVGSVTALDDYTVEFKWTSEVLKDDFESIISEVYIVSEKAYTESGNGMATEPVGTGAYVLDNYVSGSSVVLAANKDYWQTDDSLRKNATEKANIDELELQIITESSQLTMALETGKIDITENCGSDFLYEFQDGGQYADTYDVYVFMDNRLRTLYPNCDASSAMSNTDLRKAVFYAIDTAALAQGCFGELAVPASTFGASCYGDFLDKWAEEDYFGYDLDKAKSYLEASGYDMSQPLVLIAQNTSEYSSMAQMAAVFLQQLGLNIDIQILETAQFNNQVKDPAAWDIMITHNASYNLIISAWKSALDNRNFAWEGTRNFIKDDRLQELVLAANALDSDHEDLDAVHQYLKENAYIYTLLNTENGIVYNSGKISGIHLGKTSNLVLGACTLK